MRKLLFMLVGLAAVDAGAAFRCVDEKGITHIGDTPPPACAKVPMFEISRSGSVLRKIDPTPTAEEVKVREAEAAERKERERAAAEQRRKDLALLSTYSTVVELDMARDRNIEPVMARIASAKERIVAVDKRSQEIADEMEFYKAGKSKATKKPDTPQREVPVQLSADRERVMAERVALAKGIEGYEKEIAQIRTRFDADRRRWVELKNNPGLLRANAAQPPPGATPAAARSTVRCGDKNVSCKKGESFLCLKQDGTWHTVTCDARS